MSETFFAILVIVGLLAVLALCSLLQSKLFLDSIFAFLAPDIADRERIGRKHGKDTPEARAALAKRFGKNAHWYDARTGLIALGAVVFFVWSFFW